MTDIFANIFIAEQLEINVINTLRSWWPVYVKEIALQSPSDPNDPMHIPVGKLPAPRAWLMTSTRERESADQLPAVMAVTPGTASGKPPRQEGDGSFTAWFDVGLAVIVSADSRPNTRRLVRIYAAILRTIMLQKQSLGGFANGVSWTDESYDNNFPYTDQQTVSAGLCEFRVEVNDVANRYGGPAVFGGPPPDPDPDNQPGSNWPLVESVSADVEVMP